MATFRMRPGLRKSDPNPQSSRSLSVRFGARWRATAQDDQLLLEQEILRDHRSHATGATQLRGHDGQVQQGEQEVLHARRQRRANVGRHATLSHSRFIARIGNSRPTGPNVSCAYQELVPVGQIELACDDR